MKNYRDQTPRFRCETCVHCYCHCDFDRTEGHYCTDGAEPRPTSCMEEARRKWINFYNCDAWDAWAEKNRVDPNGICEHYEKKEGV